MKTKKIPFDYEKYKLGAKPVYEDFEIACISLSKLEDAEYPVNVCLTDKSGELFVRTFTNDGKYDYDSPKHVNLYLLEEEKPLHINSKGEHIYEGDTVHYADFVELKICSHTVNPHEDNYSKTDYWSEIFIDKEKAYQALINYLVDFGKSK